MYPLLAKSAKALKIQQPKFIHHQPKSVEVIGSDTSSDEDFNGRPSKINLLKKKKSSPINTSTPRKDASPPKSPIEESTQSQEEIKKPQEEIQKSPEQQQSPPGDEENRSAATTEDNGNKDKEVVTTPSNPTEDNGDKDKDVVTSSSTPTEPANQESDVTKSLVIVEKPALEDITPSSSPAQIQPEQPQTSSG